MDMYIHYWKREISNKKLQELIDKWAKNHYWIILLEEKLRRMEQEIYIKEVIE